MLNARRLARALVLALCVLASSACTHAPPSDVTALDQARFLQDPAATPPSAVDPRWEARTLPDRWSLAQRRAGTLGWYAFDFAAPVEPAEPWAVYLPFVVQNVQVFLDGRLLGSGGRFDEPSAQHWNRPLLLGIPPALLAPGSHRLDVRLAAPAGSLGTLPPLLVGPEVALRPLYARRHFWRVTVSLVFAVLALAVAALVGLVYVGRDTTGAYRFGVAGVLAWAASLALGGVHEPWLGPRAWTQLTAAVQEAAGPLLVMGLHRVLGLRRRWLEVALWATWFGMRVVQASIEPALLVWAMIGGAMLLALGPAVYIGAVLLRRERATLSRAYAFPAAVVVAFGLHDLWLVASRPTGGGVGLLTPYMLPALIVLAGWKALSMLARGLREAQTLNRELDARVREKHAALERTYEELRALERTHAVAQERERITRDIHDGLGGHLVSTLAMVESGDVAAADVAEALRGALDDLRLVIDSLDPGDDDLLSMLAAVRARLEPRLRRRGMRFEWGVVDVPLGTLGPERLLRVLRVVQEAITNVLKHARAASIRVATGRAAAPDGRPSAFVRVTDDGHGFDLVTAEGRGLVNMRRRATELEGDLTIETGTDGTTVTLWLPVEERRTP